MQAQPFPSKPSPVTRGLTDKSKRLSWLLRHGASELGLAMDSAGWVEVDAVLRALDISRDELETVVRENDKRRLELAGSRVRACQGHSRDNRAVTREALERSWSVHSEEAKLWHGTSLDAVASIAAEGILPGQRTHVHLAPSLASKVGKRAAVHVGLEVCPARVRRAGVTLYRAPNGVLLARWIPASCVTGLQALSKRARRREHELAALFESVGSV